MEYQIPLWIALISLIFGCLIGMFAMGVVAIDKNKEIEDKLKESFQESLRLKKRNIELRELYMDLKDREFIKLKEGD